MKITLCAASAALFLMSGAGAQAQDLINCFDPKAVNKLPTICQKELVSGTGVPSALFSKRSARTAWQRTVDEKFGNLYLDTKNAACFRIECAPSGPGAIAALRPRCVASGYPCKAGFVPNYERVPEGPEMMDKPLIEHEVIELQKFLHDKGFYRYNRDDPDGEWGRRTREAYQEWQRSKGMTVIPDNAQATHALLYQIRKG